MSYQLVEVENERIVEKAKASIPMTLASVSKIYTFYYVLNHLNENESFETIIYKDKGVKIEQGLLKGNLYLYSNGDPYFTAQNLVSLIYQLKDHGIRAIAGDFKIVKGKHWFSKRISNLGLEDQADNSGISNFNVEFNRFKVDRNSGQAIPPMEFIQLSSKKLKAPGLKYQLMSENDEKEQWIKNRNEAQKYREELPARNSLLFSGHYFKYLASIHGVKLPAPKVIENKVDGDVLARHQGLPISRLMEVGMEYSNNLIAEILLQKAIPGTPIESAAKMLSWLKKKWKDIEASWKGVNLVNGSGISLDNKSTAHNMSLFLAKILKEKSGKRKLISYLSQSGHSGGIRKRFTEPDLVHKIYGKTGSLFYVNNLSGYLRGNSGKIYAYSIFTTDTKARSILNKPNSKKVNKVRQGAKAFYGKSWSKINNLIRKWVRKY